MKSGLETDSDPTGLKLPRQNLFPSTHWSVVLAAGRHSSPDCGEALERLCRTYWYPLYAYIRRQTGNLADAQDLTQAFFERLLQHHSLEKADPARGRFRSFLLTSLNHFLADERDRSRTQKRGGGKAHFSLDAVEAENLYRLEPSNLCGPEEIYERRWALMVLHQAAERLCEDYRTAGKQSLFEEMRRFDTGETEEGISAVAARLCMPANTFKSHLRRMRLRQRELIREIVAQYLASPDDVDDEIRHLRAVLES